MAAAERGDALNLAAVLEDLSLGAQPDENRSLPAGPLRGVPPPAGRHIRFGEDGERTESPRHRTVLRGVPEPAGRYTHFDADDDDEDP